MKIFNIKFNVWPGDILIFHPKFVEFIKSLTIDEVSYPKFEVKKCTYYEDYISLTLQGQYFPKRDNGSPYHISVTKSNQYYPVGISRLDEYDGPLFIKEK